MKRHYPTLLIALVALVALTALVVDPAAYRAFNAPKQGLYIIGIFALGTLWFGMHLRRSAPFAIRLTVIELLLLARLVWLMLVSPDWATHPSDAGFLLTLALTLSTLLMRQCHKVWERPSVRIAGTGLLVALFLAEIMLGFWQYLPEAELPATVKTAMIGTIGSANGYGLLLALGGLTGLALLSVPKGWVRIAGGLLILMNGVALYLNGSRGAVLSFVVTGTAVGWLLFGDTLRRLAAWPRLRYLLAVCAVMALGVLAVMLYRIDPESSGGRLMVWELSLPMVADHPLTGLGQGRYSVAYLEYQAEFFANPEHRPLAYKAANLKQAHNEYLQAFCESGIPGGLLFLGIWIAGMWGYVRYLRQKTVSADRATKTVIATAVTMLLAVLIHSFVDTPLHVLPVAAIAWMLLGMSPIQAWNIRLGRAARGLLFALMLGLTVWAGSRFITQYPGYYKWQQGVTQAEWLSWDGAIDHYQTALDRLPEKGELLFHLGSAQVMQGAYSRGLYHLEQAQATFNDRNIYLSQSYGYLKLGQYQRARDEAETALAMFPDQLAPHLLLGEIYYELGEMETAKASLRKCIRQETSFTSDEVDQITEDAKRIWRRQFGRLE